MGKSTFSKLVLLMIALILCEVCGCRRTPVSEITFDESQDTAEETVSGEPETENIQSSEENGKIFVYVCGQVADPDVYEVDSGARVYEVLDLAGGMLDTADAGALNLADLVTDGEKIYVPAEGEAADSGFDVSSASDGLVNINTATQEELMTLPGIGETRAAAIIAYRESNGSFSDIQDILNVSGIGDSILAQIESRIKVN